MSRSTLNRRELLKGGALALGFVACPSLTLASPDEVQALMGELYSGRHIEPGKVTVKIPPISENGFSVPMEVDVDSPMTAGDHVKGINVFAEKNPLPNVARFTFSPASAIARVETRIRLADSQRIVAVAEMNDGSLWSGYAFTIVTLAACVV